MFRVTERMGAMASERDLGRLAYDLMKAQRQASDGQRVASASDDPVAARAAVVLEQRATALGQHEQNVSRSLASLDLVDDALFAATDALSEANLLALQLANGTMSAEDRQAAASRVAGLRQQLVTLANTEDGDGFSFAGHQTDQAAYDAAGNYLGDAGVRQVEVDAGLTMRVGLTGSEVFSPAGGQDAFAALDALEAALTANDAVAVAAAGGQLEAARDQVAQAHGKIGQQLAGLLAQGEALADRAVRYEAERVGLLEADAVEALSELVEAQQALESALRVSGSMMKSLSLVGQL